MKSKAESRRQKAEGRRRSFVYALISLGGLASLAGCGDNPSPAAQPSQTVSIVDNKAAADVPAAKPAAKPNVANQPLRDISFDTIKFDMHKEEPFARSMIKPAIEQLDHSKIRIRGYMLPSFQQSGITQFVLVRDNMQCCFGPGAALYDCIVVQMDEGQSADFTTQPVAVEGVFSIDVLKGPEEKCLAVYRLQAQKVK